MLIFLLFDFSFDFLLSISSHSLSLSIYDAGFVAGVGLVLLYQVELLGDVKYKDCDVDCGYDEEPVHLKIQFI